MLLRRLLPPLLLALALQVPSGCRGGKVPLYLGGYLPMSGRSWTGGIDMLPGIQIAIDYVNNRSDLLPDHELRFVWNDTQGSASLAMKILFDHIHRPPVKMMLLGPAVSSVAIPVAQASRNWNLIQFSFSARSSELSNRDRFPYFFRTLPADTSFNPVRIAMFRHFGWNRIATLHENTHASTYSASTYDLLARLTRLNFTVVASESFREDPSIALDNLKNRDARIIVASFYATTAMKVFCEAYKRKMYGRKYVWILLGWTMAPGWWSPDLWSLVGAGSDCTYDQVREAQEGHFITDYLGLQARSDSTVVLSRDEYETHYKAMHPSNIGSNLYGAFAFDAVMSIAVTLNKSIDLLNGTRLEDFTYERADMALLFKNLLETTVFDGLTGPVGYDQTGNRLGLSTILQSQKGGSWKTVIYYYPFDGKIVESTPVVWHDNHVPADGMTTRLKHLYISRVSFGCVTAIAVAGLVLSALILSFNIRNRALKYVKLSSPNLNNLMLVGGMMDYMAVILIGLDAVSVSNVAFDILCTVKVWVLSLGFTLAFGSLFAKTWRVHQIMSNKTLTKKNLKDIHLFAIVFVLIAIDVGILTAWVIVDRYSLSIAYFPGEVDEHNDDLVYKPQRNTCRSHYEAYWLATVYIYKGMLLLFGLFLAWTTRNVTVAALNDSKYIGMSVYNVVLVCVVAAPIGFLVGDDKFESSYVITSLFVVFSTTITICLIFVPKVIELRKNPEGTVNISIMQQTRNKVAPVNSSVATEQPGSSAM